MTQQRIVLIAAVAENGVIGDRGLIPWKIPGEQARFKKITMGFPVIMGRKTWESLPRRPLPGRTNIVLSGTMESTEGAIVTRSSTYALSVAGETKVFVIGGAKVYADFFPIAHEIEITIVYASPNGDTFFPFKPRETPNGWYARSSINHEAQGETPRYQYTQLVRTRRL